MKKLALLLALAPAALSQPIGWEGLNGQPGPPQAVGPAAPPQPGTSQGIVLLESRLDSAWAAYGALFAAASSHELQGTSIKALLLRGGTAANAGPLAERLRTEMGGLQAGLPAWLAYVAQGTAGPEVLGRTVRLVTLWNQLCDFTATLEVSADAGLTSRETRQKIHASEPSPFGLPSLPRDRSAAEAARREATAVLAAGLGMKNEATRLQQGLGAGPVASGEILDSKVQPLFALAQAAAKLKAVRNQALVLLQRGDLEADAALLARWRELDSGYRAVAGAAAGLKLEYSPRLGFGRALAAFPGPAFPERWLVPAPQASPAGAPPAATSPASDPGRRTGSFPEAAQGPATTAATAGTNGSRPGVPGNGRPIPKRPSSRAGFIPDPLVDARLDEPIRSAANVFDVYSTLVGWLATVYPENGRAGAELKKLAGFLEALRWSVRDGQGDPTVDMPGSIDDLMAVLRAEGPGAGQGFRGEAANDLKAQVATALMLPFVHLRGITYRVRPMLERSFAAHTAAIAGLRACKNEISKNAGANALAIFEFLTYPMATDGRSPVQFHQPSEFQAWLEQHFIPTLDSSIRILERVAQQAPASYAASLDLSIFLVADSPFPEDAMEQGIRGFGKAELHHLLAGFLLARAGLHGACAYQVDDLAAANNEVAETLFKQFVGEKVPFGRTPRMGVPASTRYGILEKQARLFTVKNAGQGPLALADLRTGWAEYERAMGMYYAQSASNRDDRLVNLRAVQATRRDFATKLAPEIRAALAGRVEAKDRVTGRSVPVDLPGLLGSLPRDLKDFFPAAFDEGRPYREMTFSTGKINYSNYDFGNPVGWKLAKAAGAWKKAFPGLPDTQDGQGHWVAPLRLHLDLARTYLGPFLAPLVAMVVD